MIDENPRFSIDLNDHERLYVRYMKNDLGEVLYDFREFFKNNFNEWSPTKRGFRLPVALVEELITKFNEFKVTNKS